eukprot:jgi/Bigna1/78982/fgenesh1_pg.58_\
MAVFVIALLGLSLSLVSSLPHTVIRTHVWKNDNHTSQQDLDATFGFIERRSRYGVAASGTTAFGANTRAQKNDINEITSELKALQHMMGFLYGKYPDAPELTTLSNAIKTIAGDTNVTDSELAELDEKVAAISQNDPKFEAVAAAVYENPCRRTASRLSCSNMQIDSLATGLSSMTSDVDECTKILTSHDEIREAISTIERQCQGGYLDSLKGLYAYISESNASKMMRILQKAEQTMFNIRLKITDLYWPNVVCPALAKALKETSMTLVRAVMDGASHQREMDKLKLFIKLLTETTETCSNFYKCGTSECTTLIGLVNVKKGGEVPMVLGDVDATRALHQLGHYVTSSSRKKSSMSQLGSVAKIGTQTASKAFAGYTLLLKTTKAHKRFFGLAYTLASGEVTFEMAAKSAFSAQWLIKEAIKLKSGSGKGKGEGVCDKLAKQLTGDPDLQPNTEDMQKDLKKMLKLNKDEKLKVFNSSSTQGSPDKPEGGNMASMKPSKKYLLSANTFIYSRFESIAALGDIANSIQEDTISTDSGRIDRLQGVIDDTVSEVNSLSKHVYDNPCRDGDQLLITSGKSESSMCKKVHKAELKKILISKDESIEDIVMMLQFLKEFSAALKTASETCSAKIVTSGVSRFYRAWAPKLIGGEYLEDKKVRLLSEAEESIIMLRANIAKRYWPDVVCPSLFGAISSLLDDKKTSFDEETRKQRVTLLLYLLLTGGDSCTRYYKCGKGDDASCSHEKVDVGGEESIPLVMGSSLYTKKLYNLKCYQRPSEAGGILPESMRKFASKTAGATGVAFDLCKGYYKAFSLGGNAAILAGAIAAPGVAALAPGVIGAMGLTFNAIWFINKAKRFSKGVNGNSEFCSRISQQLSGNTEMMESASVSKNEIEATFEALKSSRSG